MTPTELQGNAQSGVLLIPQGKTVRLPRVDCRMVMLSNWTVITGELGSDNILIEDGGVAGTLYAPKLTATSTLPDAAVNKTELYYGFGEVLAHQLFPGETSNLLPVSNLDQISVRSHPDYSGVLYYTFYV